MVPDRLRLFNKRIQWTCFDACYHPAGREKTQVEVVECGVRKKRAGRGIRSSDAWDNPTRQGQLEWFRQGRGRNNEWVAERRL